MGKHLECFKVDKVCTTSAKLVVKGCFGKGYSTIVVLN